MKDLKLEVYKNEVYIADMTIRDIEISKMHLDDSYRYSSASTGKPCQLQVKYGYVIGC